MKPIVMLLLIAVVVGGVYAFWTMTRASRSTSEVMRERISNAEGIGTTLLQEFNALNNALWGMSKDGSGDPKELIGRLKWLEPQFPAD